MAPGSRGSPHGPVNNQTEWVEGLPEAPASLGPGPALTQGWGHRGCWQKQVGPQRT